MKSIFILASALLTALALSGCHRVALETRPALNVHVETRVTVPPGANADAARPSGTPLPKKESASHP